MNTPICDFVHLYVESKSIRLHMPGHKGVASLGCEPYDITEIQGADNLYEADGIIRESEMNVSELFGAVSFYSTEGSSLSVKAMMYLACLYAKQAGVRPLVLAGRNAHKSFINAAVLLGFDVEWLYPDNEDTYLSCNISAKTLEAKLDSMAEKPVALYLTTPDYLGNIIDLSEISAVCRKHDILLLVDNAHGAYLKFLPESQHPIDLGADMCCDSAHKTLPVLTGGAYFHLSKRMPDFIINRAKDVLAIFGSTSPSYLILQSLDSVNPYLDSVFRRELSDTIDKVSDLKKSLASCGYEMIGCEPLKITINTKPYGYYGYKFSDILAEYGVICEYSDPDFVVLMFTPESKKDLPELERILTTIKPERRIDSEPVKAVKAQKVVDFRAACMSCCETIPVKESLNRILAVASVSCPPAIPIVVSGEKITEAAIDAFKYYGINSCIVIK